MIRTCEAGNRTAVHHVVAVPACCPVSGNPRPGSTLRVSYFPLVGRVVPVESLEAMLSEYVGGLGSIREMEHMIQHVARRCAEIVGGRVRVRADLRIAPPYGGADQRMVVTAHSCGKPAYEDGDGR